MSYYKDFVRDFPERCLKLLERGEDINFDLEVTQLLLVASSGLVIPLERLKDREDSLTPPRPRRNTRRSVNHPDVNAFLDLAQSIHEELQRPLRKGAFWRLVGISAQYQELTRPAGVELSAEGQIREDLTTEDFLTIIRNGLAHGNIFIKGPGNQHIASLTFGQTRRGQTGTDNYEFVTVSVSDFRSLLLGWFELLNTEGLTSGVISTAEAAD